MSPHPEHEHERQHEKEEHAERKHLETEDEPVYHPAHPTKILISSGKGAGWSTSAPRGSTDAFLVWMLTYEPLIKAIDKREHKDKVEEALHEFHKAAKTHHHVENLRVTKEPSHLEVTEVNYPFEVRDHEGSEKVVDITSQSGGVGHRRNINF